MAVCTAALAGSNSGPRSELSKWVRAHSIRHSTAQRSLPDSTPSGCEPVVFGQWDSVVAFTCASRTSASTYALTVLSPSSAASPHTSGSASAHARITSSPCCTLASLIVRAWCASISPVSLETATFAGSIRRPANLSISSHAGGTARSSDASDFAFPSSANSISIDTAVTTSSTSMSTSADSVSIGPAMITSSSTSFSSFADSFSNGTPIITSSTTSFSLSAAAISFSSATRNRCNIPAKPLRIASRSSSSPAGAPCLAFPSGSRPASPSTLRTIAIRRSCAS
mmetsp:Transcript_29672/g.49837  ORF Transcript_29672/g.49837 Transcript_29672/m.49837 type:complete len:283 (-) Transcript_29672:211-1059(-)